MAGVVAMVIRILAASITSSENTKIGKVDLLDMADRGGQSPILPFRQVLPLVLVLCVVTVLLYPLLPIPPYHYTATEITPSNATLHESELRAGADRNSEVRTVGDLSPAGRDAATRALAQPNNTTTLDGEAPTLLRTTYLAGNATLYRVSISESGDSSAVTLEPVPNPTAVSVLSVSLHTFDDGLSGLVHRSDREVVKTTVQNGELRTHRCVPVNNTIVATDDSYFRIRSDRC